MRDTQFWVPEIYNSIIQPSPGPPRKTSRLQSTLDREIYSKAHDTSYLQAADPEVRYCVGFVGQCKNCIGLKEITWVKFSSMKVSQISIQFLTNWFLIINTFILFMKVFDGKNDKRPSTISMMRRNTSSLKRGDVAKRLASEQGSRGMLNFSIQYKQAT